MPKNMKYDAVSSKAGAAKEKMGAYKRKGAAESKYLSEDGDVIDQNKKTAGPGKGKMHMDKKGPAEFGGKKGDDSKSKKDYEGPGEYAGKKGDDSKSKKDYEGPGKGKMHMNKKDDGPAKGKMHMDKKSDGPGRSMGYTQNFGPARVNGYAKGAAKVNSIMGKGPAEGFFDTAKKVVKTGVRAFGDIGTQAIDMLTPDGGSKERRSPGATSMAEKIGRKKQENEFYQKSRDLTASGQTYFNLSNVFDDDGKGGQPAQTVSKNYKDTKFL